jgi:hypothetical protein
MALEIIDNYTPILAHNISLAAWQFHVMGCGHSNNGCGRARKTKKREFLTFFTYDPRSSALIRLLFQKCQVIRYFLQIEIRLNDGKVVMCRADLV